MRSKKFLELLQATRWKYSRNCEERFLEMNPGMIIEEIFEASKGNIKRNPMWNSRGINEAISYQMSQRILQIPG